MRAAHDDRSPHGAKSVGNFNAACRLGNVHADADYLGRILKTDVFDQPIAQSQSEIVVEKRRNCRNPCGCCGKGPQSNIRIDKSGSDVPV